MMIDLAFAVAEAVAGSLKNLSRGSTKMIYLIAVVFPPLAVLLVGKPIQAFLNLFLCLLLYVPGLLHAILVINDMKATKRHRESLTAMNRRR